MKVEKDTHVDRKLAPLNIENGIERFSSTVALRRFIDIAQSLRKLNRCMFMYRLHTAVSYVFSKLIIIPKQVVQMGRACARGDFANALKWYERYYPVFKDLFIETNPGPVKAAMAMMSLLEPVWRLPMVPPSEANYTKIEAVLRSSGLLGGSTRSQHAD